MQSVRKVCLLVAILAVLSVGWRTQASHAATFYVATDGDDANAGTEESPFETLERGARELKAGDTLIVKEGTYTAIPAHGWFVLYERCRNVSRWFI